MNEIELKNNVDLGCMLDIIVEALIVDSPPHKQARLEKLLHCLVEDGNFELLRNKYMWEPGVVK
jgi:hypothetical protein